MSYFKTNKHRYAGESGSFAAAYTDQEIEKHNEDSTAHPDIRQLLSQHKADQQAHLTQEQREQWDAELDEKADKETTGGGFAAGSGAETEKGAAVGSGAEAENGFAGGMSAQTGSGGAVGSGAGSESGFAGGSGANAGSGGAAGSGAVATGGGAMGNGAKAAAGGAIGSGAGAGDGFAGGKNAVTMNQDQQMIDAIQLGEGVNTEEKTLQVYGYKLLDQVGKIPEARLPEKAITNVVNHLTSDSATDALSAGQGKVLSEKIEQLGGKLSSVYRYCGSVASYENLPTSGMEVGDVYNVEQDFTTEQDVYEQSVKVNYVAGEKKMTLVNAAQAGLIIVGGSAVVTNAGPGEFALNLTEQEVDILSVDTQTGVITISEAFLQSMGYGTLYIESVKLVSRAGDNYAWTGSRWDNLAGIIDLSGYATKQELSQKVTKVAGKGLSTNDYTDQDKNKVALIDGKADKQTTGGGFAGGNSAQVSEGGAVGMMASASLGGAAGSAAATSNGGAVGYGAMSTNGGAVGSSTSVVDGGAIGSGAVTSDGFAGGKNAKTLDSNDSAIDAVQLGSGTNSEAGSLQVYSYKLMDADGKIPAERMSDTVGTLTDLATNEKTNLVGAINELADYDEFTVTETVYNFTTSKRNVMLRANNDDPELNSCELHGTSNGQVITVYCPIAGNGRNSKDVIIYNYRESVGASVGQCVIAIGESRTFTYVNGYLNDASVSAAKSIDYGTEDYVRISKPAKRYFVEVPEGNTSTSLLQITNLSLERDKFYHVNAALNITGHNYGKIIFSGLSDIVGQYLRNGTAENIGGTYICNETDDVSVTLSLNMVPKGAFFNFDGTTLYYTHVYGDIMILIGTSTIETLKMDAWVGNEITSFGFYTLNANAPFDPHSFIEITTV